MNGSAADPGSRYRVVLALLLVALNTLLLHRETVGLPRYGDEGHHLRQIRLLCEGELRSDPKQATIPGFHAVVAAISLPAGGCSLEAARALNAVFGLLAVVAFYLALQALSGGQPLARTLQFHLLPILLPFQFLVYTDTFSLLLLLVSLNLALRGRWSWAGLVGSLSLLVRQSNVAWLLLLLLLAALEGNVTRRPALRHHLGRSWASLLGLAGFAAFVAVNAAVALHEKGSHRIGLYFGNLFFALFVYALVFLPSVLGRLWAARERLLPLPLVTLLFGAWALFLGAFRADHPYNRFEGFLRNELLQLVEAEPFLKPLFFLPVAVALAALYHTRLERPALGAVFVYALAMLLPAWVIETRYAIVPFVLLLLVRREDPPWLEALSVGWSGLLSGWLLFGIFGGRFAL